MKDKKTVVIIVGIIVILFFSINVYGIIKISYVANNVCKVEEAKGIQDVIDYYDINQRYISLTSTEVILDKRLELDLIKVIYKHFDAYERNDKTQFLETISYYKASQWDEDFENFRNHKYIIKKIVPVSSTDKLNPNGNYWVNVQMDDGSEHFPFVLGVAKEDGRWRIYAYD